MEKIRYRQIHLDFHTSEHIEGIAKNFDKVKFADTLEKAHVDSVTCFARCHHGMMYYPSKTHPELVHPHLANKNLLLEQIEECHKRNIKVPIYTTVQWDARIMREHPEWLAIDAHGEPIDSEKIGDPHFCMIICLNSGYRQFFKEHIADIIDVVGVNNVDGFFMDILFSADCSCNACKSEMKKLNMDTSSSIERLKYSLIMRDQFKEEITQLIRQLAPNAGIFYNSSHIGPAYKKSFKDYTHLELESLPSGGWGYDHFPATSRYARTLNKDMIGMTGKFHTYWGDFHSLKNRPALELECLQMLAFGAGCSIGDQLHPWGELSKCSYDLIEKIYEKVKMNEAYCRDAKSVTEIAVINPEEFYKEGQSGISKSIIGTVRMLQELSYQFDVVDTEQNLDKYTVVILPDCIYYTENLENILKNYIAKGGKVIGSYDSCIQKNTAENIYGVEFIGNSKYYREFVMPNNVIGKNLPKEEFVLYTNGYDVKPVNCDVLMDKIKPFFNREGNTFCSHQHAPSSGEKTYPQVTKNGDVLYFSHPIFSLYRKNAASWCKEMVKDAIDLLLSDKLVSHNGPSTVITSLNEKNGDYILHVLHYITEKRSEDIFTVSDIIPLHNLTFKIFVDTRAVSSVVGTNENIAFTQNGKYIEFTMDKLEGNALVVIK